MVPIIRRELLGLLRSRRAFWISVLTVGGASLLPLLNWPEEGSPMPFVDSREAYWGYTLTLRSALYLFVTLVAASSITLERERDTYALLLSTLIRPSGIVIGKLVASCGFFILLLVLSFPMACILYLLGGFEIREFLMELGDMTVLTLMVGVIGISSSMQSRRTRQALLSALPMVFGVFLLRGIKVSYGFDSYKVFLYGFYAALFILLVASLVRSARFPEPPPLRPQTERRPLAPSKNILARLVLARSELGIPDDRNPVFDAALRSDPLWTAGPQRSLFWGVFGGSVLALCLGEATLTGIAGTNTLLYVLALVVVGASAASIGAEKELGKLDLLRSTLLTPYQIIEGKLRASLLGFWIWPISGMIFCLLLVPLRGPMIVLFFLISSAAVSLVAASSGLLASTLCRTTVASLVLAYVITMGLLIAGPLLLASEDLSPLLSFSRISTSGDGPFWGSIGLSIVISTVEIRLSVLLFKKRWMHDP